MSSAPMTARDARNTVVESYRVRRAPHQGPRDVAGIEVWEDPAPVWVADVCDRIEKHSGAEPDKGHDLMLDVCRWCDEGDPVARALRVLTLCDQWIGPRCRMLRQFVGDARRTKGGETLADEGHWRPVGERLGLLLREWGLPVRAGARTGKHDRHKTLEWLDYILNNREPSTSEEEMRIVWKNQRALHAAWRLGRHQALDACWDEVRRA